MKLIVALALSLIVSEVACAQLPANVFHTAQRIRFLDSNRQDVRKLFAGYESDPDEEGSDTFTAPGVEVNVSYASGECSETAGSNSYSQVWNVKSGKVIKVEIRFDDPVGLAEFTLDTSSLTKDMRDEEEPGDYVQFSKTKGIMFDIGKRGVERIVLFPPASKEKSLCGDNTWGQGFYSSKVWFDGFNLDIVCILRNMPANVDRLELSSTQIETTLDKAISVVTTASDPENDPLTYTYIVSGGRIRGTGYKVTWDLTGVPPGTYTITAGVDDGAGVVGRTITKSITVK
jgi:hypothetical protein